MNREISPEPFTLLGIKLASVLLICTDSAYLCHDAIWKKAPAKTVSVLLGHTDISVTINTYSHVFPEIKSSAIEELPDYASEKVKNAFG